MKKNLSILSTIATNIGDEFIRDGILSVVDSFLPLEELNIQVYNKHHPWTLFPSYHPVQLGALLNKTIGRGWKKTAPITTRFPGNVLFKSDIVIQSGTPVLWEGFSSCEWADAFWRQFVFRNRKEIPVLNIGAGSCFSYLHPPTTLTDQDAEMARQIITHTNLTTARDKLAGSLFTHHGGQEISVLTCPAFLAGQFHAPVTEPSQRLLLNIMPIAGHFNYEQDIRKTSWRTLVQKLIDDYTHSFKIEFVCHSQDELSYAQKNWPSYKHHAPTSPENYFTLLNDTFAAITNRLHAAVGLSGLGIPCIAIGTDTRLLMTKQAGIPSYYAPDLTYPILKCAVEKMIAERGKRSETLLKTREELHSSYCSLLSKFFG